MPTFTNHFDQDDSKKQTDFRNNLKNSEDPNTRLKKSFANKCAAPIKLRIEDLSKPFKIVDARIDSKKKPCTPLNTNQIDPKSYKSQIIVEKP